jgi:hypothetical protein
MYEQKISRENPQLIVILIDQSASMSEIFFSADGTDYSVASSVKAITDKCLYEIFRNCNSGENVRPYVDLAIIGYGTSIRSATPKIPMEQLPFSVTELPNSYIASNKINDSDIGGIPKPRFEWVEEKASGTTSMLAALQKAKEITEKWIADHRKSFPPMILNITDGMPTDDSIFIERVQYGSFGDLSTLPLVTAVRDIQKLATTDGNVLLCNAHVTPDKVSQITYPTNTQDIENPFAELIFEMSSVIPDQLIDSGVEMGLPIHPGSRLFLYNAEVTSLLSFMRFGTSAAFIGTKEALAGRTTDTELEDKSNSDN